MLDAGNQVGIIEAPLPLSILPVELAPQVVGASTEHFSISSTEGSDMKDLLPLCQNLIQKRKTMEALRVPPSIGAQT